MCNTLQVRWTIVPKIAPQPWIMCGGCGGLRAFQSSDKIRLNANGRKLDAWLIYKCTTCDKTWNRSIFERKNVRDIEPAILEALQSNDPHWIRAETFNLEALKKKSQRIDEFASFEIRKELLRADSGWIRLEMELSVPFSASMRLDRLLASELQISRSRLRTLYESGLLQANSDRTDILRRRIKDGLRIAIDLSNLEDRDLFWKPPAIDEIADR
ncbi:MULTISPECIES: DUF1062 domain-containing protein [Rhizobium]|uniref:Uncharacterized protein n=1 Tax=Rhizobium favelukesii TaxID=348824 RepID=W6S8Z8_9HYPH|nr:MULTISPECIES: DUF1062 domain-containing protein [Rhizobium]MCS0460567.1 DUF1062 domain-containing protein [Rhizobium favelukesii]UFS79102.1 DUF1062 domain-containing protein [Rhizobium sp. T136]CDM62601.1 hypothetical protein LPU83_pLPU83d_1231 [Rhizobium favelukesii]